MGKEIRRVPKNWEHPKNEYGNYIGLMDDYCRSLGYWLGDCKKFIKNMEEVIEKGECTIYDEVFTDQNKVYEYFTEDGQLNPPNINDYMPSGDWYQLFETVSEGTPLTPPFKTKEELVLYLVEHGEFCCNKPWDIKIAQSMIDRGSVPSMVITGGKIYRGQESLAIDNEDKDQ